MADYARNKNALREYEILESYEAGLELTGHEVKAIRAGLVALAGSFVRVREGEAYLVGATVSPYQPHNAPVTYEKDRPRKLLLRKKELQTLVGIAAQKGLTLLPTRMYNKGTKIKLEIAVARGKRKYEKRETIKKREVEREMRRGIRL